jgi:hypothetical protein
MSDSIIEFLFFKKQFEVREQSELNEDDSMTVSSFKEELFVF